MPVDAVWIIVTVPRKEHEIAIRKLKKQLNNNFSDDLINFTINNEAEFSHENNLKEALDLLEIEDVVWMPSKNGNFFQVYFPCDLHENDATLQYLQTKGIGTKHLTSIGYIPFSLFYYDEYHEYDEDNSDCFRQIMPGESNEVEKQKCFKEVTHNFLKSVTSRLTVAQVVEGVRNDAELTFDFYCYTLFAGLIAAVGLLTDQVMQVIAATLIEPIMGTVICITFGAVIEDRDLLMTGVKSCVVSIIICMIEGYIFGMIYFIFIDNWNPTMIGLLATHEMLKMGTTRTLIYGVLTSLPAGSAVAVVLLNNNQAGIVGAAVATTFLPTVINTELLWAFSTNIQLRGLYEKLVPLNISGHVMYMKESWAPKEAYHVVYSNDMRIERALLGAVSMAMTAINIICMIVFAYILFKIKEVIPLGKLTPHTNKFFKEDIKTARNYNRKSMANRSIDTLGEQILTEWAEISGLDTDELLNDKPEAKITQLNTLLDIAQDVESDQNYKLILRNAYKSPEQSQLIRRLSQPIIYGNQKRSSVINMRQTSVPYISEKDQNMIKRINGRRNTQISGEEENIEKTSITGSTSGISVKFNLPVGRGLKPIELEGKNRRGSTAQLIKALESTVSSPYSVWPIHVNQLPTSDQNIRRRNALNTIIEIHEEFEDSDE